MNEKDILRAIERGLGPKLEEAIAQGLDVDTPIKAKGGKRTTLLLEAVNANHDSSVSIVRFLLGGGADVRVVDDRRRTPLHLTREVEVAKALIEAGADIDAADQSGASPLHSAASHGDLDVVECLLGAGASVDHRDHDGKNAYQKAKKRDVRVASKKAGSVGLPTTEGTVLAPEEADIDADELSLRDGGLAVDDRVRRRVVFSVGPTISKASRSTAPTFSRSSSSMPT